MGGKNHCSKVRAPGTGTTTTPREMAIRWGCCVCMFAQLRHGKECVEFVSKCIAFQWMSAVMSGKNTKHLKR